MLQSHKVEIAFDFRFVIYYRKLCSRVDPVYQAIRSENIDFDEVLISPTMVQDHMPDKVMEALEKVMFCFFKANHSFLSIVLTLLNWLETLNCNLESHGQIWCHSDCLFFSMYHQAINIIISVFTYLGTRYIFIPLWVKSVNLRLTYLSFSSDIH